VSVTCRCGLFDMPDVAMKIEARGYSVHARHECSWGQRKQDAELAEIRRAVEAAAADARVFVGAKDTTCDVLANVLAQYRGQD
jgi:hypothetical protein